MKNRRENVTRFSWLEIRCDTTCNSKRTIDNTDLLNSRNESKSNKYNTNRWKSEERWALRCALMAYDSQTTRHATLINIHVKWFCFCFVDEPNPAALRIEATSFNHCLNSRWWENVVQSKFIFNIPAKVNHSNRIPRSLLMSLLYYMYIER